MATYWRFETNRGGGVLIDDGGDSYLGAYHQNRLPTVRVPKAETIQDAVRAFWHAGVSTSDRLTDIVVEKCQLAPGQYYPRIDRPNLPLASNFHFAEEWSSSVRAVRNILNGLEEVFRVVEPSAKNADAYGHQMRQLLILACTEVESACKSVLKANNYPTPKKDRWSTQEFVRVADPLRLREWEVTLLHHRGYPSFKPFEGWNSASPTTSLTWYDAYNQVKHDREEKFDQAILKNLIHAAGAAYVAVYAQFGQFGLSGFNLRELDAFYVSKPPKWPLGEHCTMPLIDEKTDWTPVDYPFT